ncbi:hypothetical protein [Apilactobacillus xinyiensis]|uniref:hypothetical protein n=1 Tax=Apilactobacillus xinyiensis TaxID=2841032 RepID=UPI00200D1E45|nr:hypothetical protein [Apilactobacillus xinyiensis]MCL0330550.1 hypothetical protein [Apilactobacillus xinyiensis]
MALSEARKKANKKWDEKNKARKNYINKRSAAKSFILKYATDEDVEEMDKLIEERRTNGKK